LINTTFLKFVSKDMFGLRLAYSRDFKVVELCIDQIHHYGHECALVRRRV